MLPLVGLCCECNTDISHCDRCAEEMQRDSISMQTVTVSLANGTKSKLCVPLANIVPIVQALPDLGLDGVVLVFMFHYNELA